MVSEVAPRWEEEGEQSRFAASLSLA